MKLAKKIQEGDVERNAGDAISVGRCRRERGCNGSRITRGDGLTGEFGRREPQAAIHLERAGHKLGRLPMFLF